MIEVKAYKCDYCHRCFGRPVNAVQHEKCCKNNPVKRSCITCVHGVLGIIRYTDDIGYINGMIRCHNTKPVFAPYCDKFDKSISDKPYLIDCETTGDPFPERPIPFTCFEYEYKGKAEWTKEGK